MVAETLIIVPKASQHMLAGLGTYVRGDALGLTLDPVKVGDRYIKNLRRYEVTAVREVYHLGGDSLSRREVDLAELPFENLVGSTYSDSDLQDPRYRTKVYLDSYLDDLAVYAVGTTTTSSLPRHLIAYGDAPYDIVYLFKNLGYDVVYRLGEPSSTPLLDAFHKAYAYQEEVPIFIDCIEKTNLDGNKLKWQAETELRRVLASYPTGTSSTHLRTLNRVRGNNRWLGNTQIYGTELAFNYRRVNSDYTPTYPTFTESMGFTYEGDRTSGGLEGTWTLTTGGSTATQSVNSERNLVINCTVFIIDDQYTTNGTNLGLATDLYPYIRFRYRTTGSATAKVIAELRGPTYQTLLSETASSTFSVVNAELTSGAILDHLILYCCDGTGTVTYDFVQVYGSTYILPNCVVMDPPLMVRDVDIPIPSRSGDLTNAQGTHCLEVSMECDLTMEPEDLTWKRPQTDTTKTDYNNTDILYETQHLGGANAQNLWTWLDLGDPSMQFKARLKSVEPSYTGEEGRVRLTWREYRHGSAGTETTSERFGLSL